VAECPSSAVHPSEARVLVKSRQCRRRSRTTLLAVLVTGAIAAVGSGAGTAVAAPATPSATPSATAPSTPLHAIVALRGTTAVTVPGVHLVSMLPGVHAELVTADAAGLAALRERPEVVRRRCGQRRRG
jgi:hypothetical protein